MRLYDTARREVVPFEPSPMVRMYVCGITPYDSTHLGHAATYITYDLLIRRLEELGHEVRMVRNITDVDDSILPKARELGIPYLELAAAEIERFQGDIAALELRPAVAEPRATDAVPQIIELVGQLLDSGHAYLSGGYVYFDVSTFPDFGKLSHYPEDRMVKLARARGGNPDDPHRRAPLDFVLWQPSLADEPAWRAPFGIGRPGWHIECSAMVSYEGEKMSKSLGNLVFVSDLLKIADPRAIRLALMRHHYRSGFEWYDTDLDEAVALLHRLLAAAERPDGPAPAPFAQRVRDAIDDDLDAPRALEALDDLASAILSGGADTSAPAALRELGALLGIDLSRPIATGV